MASPIPCFFLAPTWDFPPPPAGPIKIGNVITSLKTPERALFTAPLPDDSDVFSSGQQSFLFSTEKLREHQYGVFTKFLSFILGAGVDTGVSWETSNSSVFEFETIQTTQFLAKPRYLEKCISAGPVLRFLEKSRYRKPIYIITGLKVVSGAKVKSLHSRSAGSEFNAEVDLTALGGGPVGIGPQIIARRGGTEEISWQGCNDFVFAFRVRKIMVAKKDASVKVDEDYKKGAMLDGELPCFQNPELVVLTEEEGDDDENFLTEETIEGGEAVLCAAFRPRADNPS